MAAPSSAAAWRSDGACARFACRLPTSSEGMPRNGASRTPALAAMHTVGKLFPKSDRAPAIEPVAPAALSAALAGSRRLASWRRARTERVASGFYTSQAMELVAA